MEKRILIVGASGAIGQPLCARLRSDGHVVFGIHRSPQSAEVLRSLDVTPLNSNVFDEAAVKQAFEVARPDVVIHQLTALPKVLDPRLLKKAARVTADLRRQTVPLFARLSQQAGARFIAQSINTTSGWLGTHRTQTRVFGRHLGRRDDPLSLLCRLATSVPHSTTFDLSRVFTRAVS